MDVFYLNHALGVADSQVLQLQVMFIEKISIEASESPPTLINV